MDSQKLKSATVVLYEANGAMRLMVKSALLGIGFGFVDDCRTMDQVRDAADADTKPDVFVLDLDKDKDTICGMISDIRHSRLGDNPFVIIIGMTRYPEEMVIHKVLDAGTDDLVAKPVSSKILSERIAYLSEHRKDFLATPGYLGPERAKGVRPNDEEAATVKVPNSLRVKLSGRLQTEMHEIESQRAANSFILQRLYGIILPIINISTEMEKATASESTDIECAREISRIVGLLSEFKGIEMPATVRDLNHLTVSLEKVVDMLAEAPSPSPNAAPVHPMPGRVNSVSRTRPSN
ncbi:MAG: response regulator transcription factor [Proteobacteria bacterium]|nr:response regulator transcription factor [Pseudomonadota bacterium]